MNELDRRIRIVHDAVVDGGSNDPLLQAMIDKLPKSGSEWPPAARQAWLTMMNNAFDVVYGGPAGGSMAAAKRPAAAKARPRPTRPASKSRSRPAAPRPLKPAGPAFFIDRGGIARRAGGDRIMPSEVMGILVDKRGQNGDLATITWADESMGIPRGLQLDIGISDGD